MTSSDASDQHWRHFAWLMIASALGYAILTWLSWQFVHEVPTDHRPTLWMLLLFAFEFLCYWRVLKIAVKLSSSRYLLGAILGGACLFRAIMLPSVPMHEIDIYRYIWDGAVMAEGISPYRFAPQQVLDAVDSAQGSDDLELQRLVALQSRSESLAYGLGRIHYGDLPSPYPMVSQAAFALAAQLTPDAASSHARMVGMKLLVVLFDMATLLVVMALVKEVGLHPGWSIAYGWCPLVLKEFANGWHLDSVAIFFTTLAIWMLVRTCGRAKTLGWSSELASAACVGGVLALAIGAKLYPVVLAPLFAALWWRRCGGLALGSGVLTTTVVSLGLLYPMVCSSSDLSSLAEAQTPAEEPPPLGVPGELPAASGLLVDVLPPPRAEIDSSAGIRAFLKHWEMNDLIFMIVLENLRPQTNLEPHERPWFVVVPDAWSSALVARWTAATRWLAEATRRADLAQLAEPVNSPETIKDSSFLLARGITGVAFVIVAFWLAWRAAGQADPQAWCRAGMLTLAWLWLTCPTQNPWYWCWVVPLLPFVRYRAWYAMAACSLLYYLRFWFTAHYPDPPVFGTPYNGSNFFYFVVVWIEFAPILLALAVQWWVFRKGARP